MLSLAWEQRSKYKCGCFDNFEHFLSCLFRYKPLTVRPEIRPYKKFPVPARITFGERINNFIFISLNLMYTTIHCLLVKADQFCPFFNKNTFLSNFTFYFYDKNTFHMICGKCKIILVSKISISTCRKDKK